MTEAETIRNLQARLNLVSHALSTVAGQLCNTQPSWVAENIGQIMQEWAEAEAEYPLPED